LTQPALGIAVHLVALVLLMLQAGLGARILARLRWDRLVEDGLERALFAWTAGFVATSASLMLLSAVGLLGPTSVLLTALGMAILAAPCIREAASALMSARREAWRSIDGRRGLAIAAAVGLLGGCAIWLVPIVVQTLLPNADWDSALYHLPLASRYLGGELFNTDPQSGFYSFPGAVSLLYAALIALGLEAALIPLNFQVVLLGVAASWALGKRLGGSTRAGVWAAAILCTNHVIWQLAVDPRIDGFLAFFLAMAFLALARFWGSGRDPGSLPLLALALNAALGCKYTGLLFAGGLSVIAFGLLAWRRPSALSVRLIARYSFVLLVPGGLWYAANVALHGDPVYPMLRGSYFHDAQGDKRYLLPALEPYVEQGQRDPAIRQRTLRLMSRAAAPVPSHLFNLYDIVNEPNRYSVKPNHFVSPLLVLSLFLPLVSWGKTQRRTARFEIRRGEASLVWVVSLAFYALLASQTNLVRYIIPLLPVFAATAGCTVAAISARSWHALWAVLSALLLIQNWNAERRKVSVLAARPYLSGEIDRVEWLKRVGYNLTPAMGAMIDEVNRRIADGAMSETDRLLMVGEGKGYLLECSHLPDSSWFLERWLVELMNANLDHRVLRARLQSEGVTHILYNHGYFEWVRSETDTPPERLAFGMVELERFLKTYGVTLHEGDAIDLVKLRPTASR
jgi:hypothetical protein